MAELNEPQLRAVTQVSGPLLVFAGAGSGKTRVITYRIAQLIAEHRVPPYRILGVTFTNKAAGELRGRLEALVGHSLAHDLWVGTFHSVCARLLRRHHAGVGLERDFVIYDDSDQKAILSRVLRELSLSDRVYPPKRVLAKIAAQKREGVGPAEAEHREDFDATLAQLYLRYQQALRTANAVDFEDLILHVMRLAEAAESPDGAELRRRFDYVLVDEFQDTNAIQYRLVRALAPHGNLCVVGDDDQSIYGWRGADVRNIRDFRRDFPGAQVVKLEQNYRSTGHIVRAALSIIERAAEREPKALWTEMEPGAPVVVRGVRDEREEGAHVAELVRAELAQGTSLGQVAVFYRIHAQSRVLEEALRSYGITYRIIGGTRFFDRSEVKDALAYLRLIDNPRSDADLMRIINVPARGLGHKTVETLLALATARGTSGYDAIDAALRGSDLGAAAKKRLAGFRELIDGLRQAAAEVTPHELAVRVLELSGYRAALAADDSAESDARVENLEELIGSIKEYEYDCEQAGTTTTLADYLERVSLVTNLDATGDAPMATLMTVHGAKGLEFDAVILTGMEETMFPYGSELQLSADRLDEERRLAYVAVTRARRRLYVTYATVRSIFGETRYMSPSRFLRDLPEECVVFEGEARALGGLRQGRGAGRGAAASVAPRPAWAGRSGWASGRVVTGGASGLASRDALAARGAAPAAAPEAGLRGAAGSERVVDYQAFGDVSSEQRLPRTGDSVSHRRFGRGVVESVSVDGQPTIAARFPGYGLKKVRAEYLVFE